MVDDIVKVRRKRNFHFPKYISGTIKFYNGVLISHAKKYIMGKCVKFQIQHCNRHSREAVPRRLAALVLKHVYQNPRYGFEPSSALLGEEEAQRLVTICQDKIVNDRDPVTELMRMQVKTAFPQKNITSLQKLTLGFDFEFPVRVPCVSQDVEV